MKPQDRSLVPYESLAVERRATVDGIRKAIFRRDATGQVTRDELMEILLDAEWGSSMTPKEGALTVGPKELTFQEVPDPQQVRHNAHVLRLIEAAEGDDHRPMRVVGCTGCRAEAVLNRYAALLELARNDPSAPEGENGSTGRRSAGLVGTDKDSTSFSDDDLGEDPGKPQNVRR